MRVRSNLSGIIAATAKRTPSPVVKPQIGKVFGIITTENTPTKELFEQYGGYKAMGTIFYLDYDQTKNTDVVDLNKCKTAKPFSPDSTKYPLVGELVHLTDAPSPTSQVSNTTTQKYYTGIVNVWNNVQQNAPSGDSLGKTFIEKSDIRGLINFEGDIIYQGRKGNGLRFGSTVKAKSNLNEWSNVGEDGDPITILVNGYVTSNISNLTPNVEEINKERSSIYMTTSQKIPLMPGVLIKNPVFSVLNPANYTYPQVIINSDRVTLNSKRDEILLYAKTNIGLNTDNAIILNAGSDIHLHIDPQNFNSRIYLGTDISGDAPSEPVVLGDQLHSFLLELMDALSTLSSSLISANVPTSEGVTAIPDVNIAGQDLGDKLELLYDKLETFLSEKVYTV